MMKGFHNWLLAGKPVHFNNKYHRSRLVQVCCCINRVKIFLCRTDHELSNYLYLKYIGV